MLEEALIRRRRAEDLSHSVHLHITIGSLAWVLTKPDGHPLLSVDATGIKFSRTHHKDRCARSRSRCYVELEPSSQLLCCYIAASRAGSFLYGSDRSTHNCLSLSGFTMDARWMLLCRTGFCKTEVKDLSVKDQSMSLAISKQLPRGVMLTRLKDPAWRKEGFLLVNVIRGASPITWQRTGRGQAS